MTDFATLVLGARTDGLAKGEDALDRLGTTADKTERKSTAAMAKVSAGFAALAAGAAGVLSAGLALSSLNAAIGRIDAMDEAAQSIDGTVNALRALELATGEAGISSGELMSTMQAMNRELAKAQAEGGPAADALAKLGLSASYLSSLDADARLAAIADAMQAMGLSAGQATAILQDLGVRSKAMSVALLDGGDAIRQARQDIADLGLELTGSGIAAVTDANDALGRMGLASEALGNQLAVALAPALDAMATAFVNSLREGGLLRGLIDALTFSFTAIGAVLPYVLSSMAALATVMAIRTIPTIISMIAYLGTMEGMFIAGAIASRAMNAAIAFTPVGIVLAAGAGIYALATAGGQAATAATIQADAERDLADALGLVSGSTGNLIAEKQAVVKAAYDQATAELALAQALLSTAQASTVAYDAMGNALGTEFAADTSAAVEALTAAQAKLAGIVAGAEAASIPLADIVVSSGATAENLAKQYEYMGQMRAESDAALSSANDILAAKIQENEIARATLIYGADSLRVAQLRQSAERDVLSAQLDQLDVSDAVRREILGQADAGFAVANAIAAADGQAGGLAASVAKVAPALLPAVNVGNAVAKALTSAMNALGGFASGLSGLGSALKALPGPLQGFGSSFAGIGVASTAVSNLASKLLGFAGPAKVAEVAAVEVSSSLGGGGGVSGAAAETVVALTEAEQAAVEYATTMQGFVTNGIERAVDYMVGGFKDGLSGLVDIFKSTIQQMIAYAIKNKITVALGGSVGVLGGGAGAAVAGGAVPGVAPGGGLGILGQIGGIFSSFTSGASGLITALTGAGGGLATAGTYLSAVLGGATSSLGGLAAAAGAIALPIAAIIGIFSFFKKKTKELDRGLRVTVDGMNTLVESFRLTETRRFFGLSRRRSTSYEVADGAVADPVNDAVAEIQAGVMDAAATLGIGADAFSAFAYQLQISTKDLSEDQILKLITEELGNLGHAFADLIPGIQAFALAGEGSMDTLNRLSQSLALANMGFESLGLAVFDSTLAGAGAAAAMVEAMGGLEAFASGVDFYFQNFYSLGERAAEASRQFSDALGDMNFTSIPQTEAQFRSLVELLSEAGNTVAAGQLIQLAPMFQNMLDLQAELAAVGDTAGEAAEEIERANAALTERRGLEERLLTLQGNVSELRRREIMALDATNRPLQTQIWLLEDQQAAAARAAAAQTAIINERRTLEGQLWQLQGNTNAIRARELAGLDETNRALQERIYALQDEAAAAAAAAELARTIAAERAGLDRQMMQLQGDVSGLRRLELAGLDASNRARQNEIWLMQDQQAIADRAAAQARGIAQERRGLEDQLWQMQGNTRQIRARELAGLDASNRALQERIYALEDEAAEMDRNRARIEQRRTIEEQILQIQGNTAELRRLELAALMPANREMQERLYALQDEAAALAAAQAVADEREGLEERLLQLQGNTAELRRRELEALDPANRALQQMIWGLEDAQEAIENLNETDFATMFAYLGAQARAATRVIPAPAVASMRPADANVVSMQAERDKRDAAATMAQANELLERLVVATDKALKIEQAREVIGMPPVRT